MAEEQGGGSRREGGGGDLTKASKDMNDGPSSAIVVIPTEDVVQALIDYLVDPMLPVRSSSARDHTPSLTLQESVAKQMHAVVLLYNYYHRKQFQELEFLDFESFCKVAVNAKPSLLVHMKLMRRCNVESDDLEKQLSITEKMIMDACNICIGLDASRDAPSMEGWPVSKVTVFLTDSMKKNCLLLFSSITQGVWSLIEKNLDDSNNKPGDMLGAKNTNKKKRTPKRPLRDELSTYEAAFQQLAFSAVKERTGFDQTDLMVLESHVVCSLSEEKTAARFYLMECTKSINEEAIQVPIKDAINSLQGPLVKGTFGNCTVSPVVEYFHLLPYAGIVSDWLSREILPSSSKLLREVQGNVNTGFSPRTDEPCTIKVNENNDRSIDYKTSNTITGTVNQKENGECCMSDLSDAFCRPHNMAEDDSSIVCLRSEDKRKTTLNIVPVDHVEKKMESSPEDDSSITKSGESMSGLSDAFCRPHNMAEDDSSILCLRSEDKRKTTLNIVPVDHVEKKMVSSPEDDSSITKSGFKLKAEKVDLVMEPCNKESMGAKVAGGNDICNIGSSGQDGMPTGDRPLVPFQSNSQNVDKIQAIMASRGNELLQAALRVLQKKRDELAHQQRDLQDEIARCEKSLQTILSGREDDLILKIESIVEANAVFSKWATQTHMETHPHFGEQRSARCIKRKKLSEAILNLRNPCQELDEICCENNWILPRYTVFPSNGRFHANVTVQGMDFECSDSGDLHGDPREARESAAANMLSKLRSMASQAQ